VVDYGSFARLGVRGLTEREYRLAELDTVGQIAGLRAEVRAIPLYGLGGLRSRQVDVIVGVRLGTRIDGGHKRKQQERTRSQR
jgi:hypothetical protein